MKTSGASAAAALFLVAMQLGSGLAPTPRPTAGVPVLGPPTTTESPSLPRLPSSPINMPSPPSPLTTTTAPSAQVVQPPISTTRRPIAAPSPVPSSFASRTGITTSSPSARPTSAPTLRPTNFPVFSPYTERELGPYFSCSKSGPFDTAYLLELQTYAPTPSPTPSPSRSPTRLPLRPVVTERQLGGGGGGGLSTQQSPPTPAPVMSNFGFWDQMLFTRLGWQPPQSSVPSTKYYLDIRMAATGWGNQAGMSPTGQYITFYASINANSGPNKVSCNVKLALTDPMCSIDKYQTTRPPCTGQLVPIATYFPSFNPAAPQCSTHPDLSDWMEVAVNIDVSQYVTAVQGGSLILSYTTTGVTRPVCPMIDDTGNGNININVAYTLRSVNPFPTHEPTPSVEEKSLSIFSATTELQPGLGAWVLCLLLGLLLYCVLGFRLSVVRSTSHREGITPVNGAIACVYLCILGCSLCLDMALSIIILDSHMAEFHSYGVAILLARLLLILPSAYNISKVYQAGVGSITQLSEEHFEDNRLTYTVLSLFVLFDTQLLIYYPWRTTEFTMASRGYPDFERVRFATYPKTLSTVVILGCQAAMLRQVKAIYSQIKYHPPIHAVSPLVSLLGCCLAFTCFSLSSSLFEMVSHITLNKYEEGHRDILGADKVVVVEGGVGGFGGHGGHGEDGEGKHEFEGHGGHGEGRGSFSQRGSIGGGSPSRGSIGGGSGHRGSVGRASLSHTSNPMAAFAPTHTVHPLQSPGAGRRLSMQPIMSAHNAPEHGGGTHSGHRASFGGGDSHGSGGGGGGHSQRPSLVLPGTVHMPHGGVEPGGGARRSFSLSHAQPPPEDNSRRSFTATNPRPSFGAGRSSFSGHQL